MVGSPFVAAWIAQIAFWILMALGQPFEGNYPKLFKQLQDFLYGQFATSRRTILIIDEAQNLKEEVLENLRLLSNLEMAGEKLLQIVLVGQPELGIKLDQPVLRQVKQRITLQCHLGCLEEREVGPFIHYRLRAAGYEHEDLFTPQAIQRITGDADLAALGFQTLKYMTADVVLDGGYQGQSTDPLPFQTSSGTSAVGGAPSSHMYFLNTNYIHWRPHSKRNMVPLDPDRFSVNQDAMIRMLGWAGNATLSCAFLQGVIKT